MPIFNIYILFLPLNWPSIDIKNLRGKNYQEVALEVISPFVEQDISNNDLKEIIEESYKNFTHKKVAPLVKIDDNKYIDD